MMGYVEMNLERLLTSLCSHLNFCSLNSKELSLSRAPRLDDLIVRLLIFNLQQDIPNIFLLNLNSHVYKQHTDEKSL